MCEHSANPPPCVPLGLPLFSAIEILHLFSTNKIAIFSLGEIEGRQEEGLGEQVELPGGSRRVPRDAEFDALQLSIKFCPYL